MLHHFGKDNPLVAQFVAELRDTDIQQDRQRFRRNLERIGEAAALEIARRLPCKLIEVTTPLGLATCKVPAEHPVLATILRAGLPLQNGLLQMFDQADCAFISAYRKHEKNGQFTIKLDYLSCPDLNDRVLIIADPMLATGASAVIVLNELMVQGTPKQIHFVAAIACTEGIAELRRHHPQVYIWAAAIDEELTSKGYIVPGLGDAGDLAFGEKMQQ
jgi:uracil phosphoribosyltransferase